MNNDHCEDLTGESGVFKTDHPAACPPLDVDPNAGDTLRACIETAGTLSIADAITVVDQLAADLDVLHDQGKCRGCIQPANILVREDGTATLIQTEAARLSRSPQIDGGEAASADLGSAEGVPGQQNDFYGLGCTLYFMVTGRDLDASDASDAGESDPSNRCIATHAQGEMSDAFSNAAGSLLQRLLANPGQGGYASIADLRLDIRRLGVMDAETCRSAIPQLDLGLEFSPPDPLVMNVSAVNASAVNAFEGGAGEVTAPRGGDFATSIGGAPSNRGVAGNEAAVEVALEHSEPPPVNRTWMIALGAAIVALVAAGLSR